ELRSRPGAPASCGRFAVRDTAGRAVAELALRYRLSRLQDGEGEQPAPGSPAGPRAATPPATSPEPRGEEEQEEEEGEEEEEEGGEELEGNVFCPPLLYYSREPAEPQGPPQNAAGQWQRVEARRPREEDKGQSPPRPSAGPSLLHPASPRQPHTAVRQLPLLSALLAELSVLTHSALPSAAAAVHPQLPWLYELPGSGGRASGPPSHSAAIQPAEAPVGTGGSSEAASPRSKQEATSPVSPGTGRRPKKAVPRGEPASERNCKAKENRPPRKKLLYGLTNTLRLRLQQTNPDKLIILERREKHRKKRMEMVNERSPLPSRKLLRNAGEWHVVSCRSCSKGDSSKRNNQLDKIVQTSLENSALSESISVTADVAPDQKHSITSLWRNDAIASKEHPCKVTTAPLQEDSLLKQSAHEEKCVKAQFPAAFPSDANAKGNNEEAVHLIHHETTEHDDASVTSGHKPSLSRSVANNSEFMYSDDFVASPENTVYSEDFTSAECTEKDSEVLDSSPEPLCLESPKRGRSDTEPESWRSRISKTSQRAESTSDLVPVPSASSPVQSLRRNRDFKTSKRASAESADSFNLAQVEASLLDEEQKAQQISNEANTGDQHIKQISTLRSKQVRSGTDLNIGRGQPSAGEKQSVTKVSSYLPSNMSDLELSVLKNSMSEKEDDFLEKLSAPHQYKDISELVINKLPGYTM
ncbi:MAP10 protein, partial [Campylorhamphus procurvoides]|nr:MAP10 protein [Campylorhamphus procurvoides]